MRPKIRNLPQIRIQVLFMMMSKMIVSGDGGPLLMLRRSFLTLVLLKMSGCAIICFIRLAPLAGRSALSSLMLEVVKRDFLRLLFPNSVFRLSPTLSLIAFCGLVKRRMLLFQNVCLLIFTLVLLIMMLLNAMWFLWMHVIFTWSSLAI